jgi:hypothetical protein
MSPGLAKGEDPARTDCSCFLHIATLTSGLVHSSNPGHCPEGISFLQVSFPDSLSNINFIPAHVYRTTYPLPLMAFAAIDNSHLAQILSQEKYVNS